MSVPDVIINYYAVLGAAVISMVVGSFWYGPIFGKIWVKEMGFTKKSMEAAQKKGMAKLYIINLVGSLITAYVLAHFVKYLTAQTFGDSLQLALWVWIGFIASTTLLNEVVWNGRSWKLYFINAGYWLVYLIIASFVLTHFG